MPEARASGYSLWLVPDGETKDTLARTITRLASLFDTPVFAPHVTLVGGFDGHPTQILAATAAVAGQLPPLDIRLTGLGREPNFFRCLFLSVEKTPALVSAHELARKRLEAPFAAFMPHLSLVYGDLDERKKDRATTAMHTVPGLSFEARRMELWRTEGRTAEWSLVKEFGLVGPQGSGGKR